ncbi:kinase-like domain-containing protein [Mycena alexandri]|uniref:non-specific serine/threonine protein kinase n=1 Tax=Mycena alexandri TaxID=1745969 RepID=A0AAD6SIC9_9AGAR|nr:kinase-like domain-containing protein [Mycena alexandri]
MAFNPPSKRVKSLLYSDSLSSHSQSVPKQQLQGQSAFDTYKARVQDKESSTEFPSRTPPAPGRLSQITLMRSTVALNLDPEDFPKPPLGIWGYLEPLVPSANVHRINLTEPSIAIGRSDSNYVKFTGAAVSQSHATIQWNGRTDTMSVVTITDHDTTNGTFVDGIKVEGINVHRLFDGCTIFFGCRVPVVTEEADYRFTFHHAFGRSKDESLFNHYIVGDQLGGGAHGSVFRALERTTGKVFAVKTSWKHSDNSVDTVMCAGQEVMALMSLEHPNICRLHEVFFRMDGEMVDMVLEYVDGIKLFQIIQIPMDEAHARELSYQLCTAVKYMNDRGVAHGDLKSDNVLLTREDRPKIKVVDFGLAQIRGTFNIRPIVTDHCYSAPEAPYQGKDPTNTECRMWDNWGLGCLIFNVLSSEHPYPQGRRFEPTRDEISWHRLSTKSIEAQDLVRSLLVADPDHRMIAATALKHPWFQSHKPYRLSFATLFGLPPPQESDIDMMDDDSDSELEDMEAVNRLLTRKDKGKARERPGARVVRSERAARSRKRVLRERRAHGDKPTPAPRRRGPLQRRVVLRPDTVGTTSGEQ